MLMLISMPAVCQVVQADQSSVIHVLVHETFHLHSLGQHWYRRILVNVKQNNYKKRENLNYRKELAAAARRLDTLPLVRRRHGRSAACPSLFHDYTCMCIRTGFLCFTFMVYIHYLVHIFT